MFLIRYIFTNLDVMQNGNHFWYHIIFYNCVLISIPVTIYRHHQRTIFSMLRFIFLNRKSSIRWPKIPSYTRIVANLYYINRNLNLVSRTTTIYNGIIQRFTYINSLGARGAHMCQLPTSSMVYISFWRLIVAKSLSKPMTTNSWCDSIKQIIVHYKSIC